MNLRKHRHLLFSVTVLLYLCGAVCALATGIPSMLAVSTFLVAVAAWAYGPLIAVLLMVCSQIVAGIIMAQIVGPEGLPPIQPIAVLAPIVLTECLVVIGLSSVRYLELRHFAIEVELRLKNAELEAALAEVRELRGMLPVCAWCKSIRDVDGMWNQLENYLAKHSRATLTHGMCPSCLSRMMAESQGNMPAAG